MISKLLRGEGEKEKSKRDTRYLRLLTEVSFCQIIHDVIIIF